MGGSAVGMSAASGGRTPSPIHSRFAPSPSMAPQSTEMLPPRPFPVASQASPRGLVAGQTGPSAAFEGGGFAVPSGPMYSAGPPMYPTRSASWGGPGTSAQVESLVGAGSGPYGYTGGSFGRM